MFHLYIYKSPAMVQLPKHAKSREKQILMKYCQLHTVHTIHAYQTLLPGSKYTHSVIIHRHWQYKHLLRAMLHSYNCSLWQIRELYILPAHSLKSNTFLLYTCYVNNILYTTHILLVHSQITWVSQHTLPYTTFTKSIYLDTFMAILMLKTSH